MFYMICRSKSQDSGDKLEKDIGKQLSAFREQSKPSKDDDVDEFGRNVKRRPPSNAESQNRPEPESARGKERSRSPPRRWRDDDRERGGRRGRDAGRPEPRRRGRDGYNDDGDEDERRQGERYLLVIVSFRTNESIMINAFGPVVMDCTIAECQALDFSISCIQIFSF